MTKIARVTSKGQVTIPQRIRKRLGVDAGDVLVFVELESGGVMLRKLQIEPLSELQRECSPLAEASGYSEEDVSAWVQQVRKELFEERLGAFAPDSGRR